MSKETDHFQKARAAREMIWLTFSKLIALLAFFGGVAGGFANASPPLPLPDWRILAVFVVVGVLLFPYLILAIMRVHVLMGTGLEIEPPQLDRCFLNPVRPLDTLLLAAKIALWLGIGILIVFWICRPHNLIVGLGMVLGYYSIHYAIRLSLVHGRVRSS